MENIESKKEHLAKLEQKLADLKEALPEHCYGREGFIDAHRTSPEHWAKIEDLEEEIKALKDEINKA